MPSSETASSAWLDLVLPLVVASAFLFGMWRLFGWVHDRVLTASTQENIAAVIRQEDPARAGQEKSSENKKEEYSPEMLWEDLRSGETPRSREYLESLTAESLDDLQKKLWKKMYPGGEVFNYAARSEDTLKFWGIVSREIRRREAEEANREAKEILLEVVTKEDARRK